MTSGEVRKPLRILHVFHTLGVGGAEVWLLALLRQNRKLNEAGNTEVQFDICLTGGEPSDLDEEARALGAKLIYLRYDRSHVVSFIRGFRSLLRNGSYDAIHDHQGHPAGLRFLFASGVLPRIRVVHFHNPLLMLQNYSTSTLRRKTASIGHYFANRFATHIIGTSRQILREHGVEPSAKGPVYADALYCGFDVGRFAGERVTAREQVLREFGFTEAVRLMLFVGRLNSHADLRRNQKNPAFALDIAIECIKRDDRVRFLVVGGGELVRQELQKQMKELGLQSQILFLGVRADVATLMLASDLLLFPSLAEGLGMVAVEAQATGLRVLASDATPREASVVPGLCTFLPLAAGCALWVEEAMRLLDLPRADANASNAHVARSRFAIEQSTRDLLNVYSNGGPIAAES